MNQASKFSFLFNYAIFQYKLSFPSGPVGLVFGDPFHQALGRPAHSLASSFICFKKKKKKTGEEDKLINN